MGDRQKYQNLPIWLLRQYNPDIDFDDVRPGTELTLPLVETSAPGQPTLAGARASTTAPSRPGRGIPERALTLEPLANLTHTGVCA